MEENEVKEVNEIEEESVALNGAINFKNDERINLALQLIEERLVRHGKITWVNYWFNFMKEKVYIITVDDELEEYFKNMWKRSIKNPNIRGEFVGTSGPFIYLYKDKYNIDGRRSFIALQDNNETIESLAWIIVHELSHAFFDLFFMTYGFCLYSGLKELQSQDLGLGSWLSDERAKYYSTDEGHENDVEEQSVNLIANTIIGKKLDRIWWSENRKGKKEVEE